MRKYGKIRFTKGFSVIGGNPRSQAAQMTLSTRQNEGGADNRHRGADQWVYVVSGKGVAIIDRKKKLLPEGVLLLIEKGQQHGIRNTGTKALKTLNFYVPPAYQAFGEELLAGKK